MDPVLCRRGLSTRHLKEIVEAVTFASWPTKDPLCHLNLNDITITSEHIDKLIREGGLLSVNISENDQAVLLFVLRVDAGT